MELMIGEGDRLIVDISCRAPAPGELAVLWGWLGLVIKRVGPSAAATRPSFV
ncbi:MAG: S24/S26 family peptidase [Rhodospirillales bacterium]|nr:S24/S26 family peptidase [Rhodospirillales bacterium]